MQQIKSFYSNLQNMSMEINKLKQLQQTLSFNVSSIVIDLKTQLQTLTTSIEKYNLMVNIVNEGRIFRPIQNSLKNITIYKNTCKELKDLEKTLKEDKEKYNLFVSFNNQKEKIEKELNSLNLAKNNLNNIVNANSLLKDLKQEELDLIDFKNKANQVLNYQKILENLKTQINQNKNSLNSFKSFPNLFTLLSITFILHLTSIFHILTLFYFISQNLFFLNIFHKKTRYVLFHYQKKRTSNTHHIFVYSLI